MHIPKFRNTRRLVLWCQVNFKRERLPAENEKCFFSGKEDPRSVASNVASYASLVGKLDVELEALLKPSHKAILSYFGSLHQRDLDLPQELVDELKGDDENLLLYAKNIVRGRLPSELEDTFSNPNLCLSYAQFIRGPLPEHLEEKVFSPSDRADAGGIANILTKYAAITNGVLREGLKNRLKASNSAIIEYGRLQKTYGRTLDVELQDCLSGDSHRLYELASTIIVGRLPEHLENTMSDGSQLYQYAKMIMRGQRLPANLEAKLADSPDYCVKYAEEIVCGRLPEEVEVGLMKDHNAAVRYAFNVIRAFAPVRLPEQIHAYLVMKSFELPNDVLIKKYIDACDSDPNKAGNSAARVN
jgi:hypothetical protein